MSTMQAVFLILGIISGVVVWYEAAQKSEPTSIEQAFRMVMMGVLLSLYTVAIFILGEVISK